MLTQERKTISIEPDDSSSIEISAWQGADILLSVGDGDEAEIIRFSPEEFEVFIKISQEVLAFAKGG